MASEVKIAIVGDSRSFSHAVSRANADADTLGDKFAKVGRMAAVGFGVAATAVGAFGVKALTAASDLNEVLSKSNTVFGESGKEIEKWAATGAKSFGQSKKQALEAAGNFGNMFTQLKIGQPVAAKMSRQMVELASDFASFHNADITEVLQAQAAAFRGEYDSVQRFVPTINAAAVEQKALEMGLAKTTKELDAQDKALAVQALLLDGAGAAAGDYGRTSGSLANQQRALRAEFDNITAQIGQAFLPVATRLAAWAGQALPVAFAAAQAATNEFMAGFRGDEGAEGTFARFGTAVRAVADDFQTKLLPVLLDFAGFLRDTVIPVVLDVGVVLADNFAIIATGIVTYKAAKLAIEGTSLAMRLMGASAAATSATMAASAGPWAAAVAAGVSLGVVLHNLIETHFPGVNRALEDFGAKLYDWSRVASAALQQVGAVGYDAFARIKAIVESVWQWLEKLGAKITDIVSAIGKLPSKLPSLPGLPFGLKIPKFHDGGVVPGAPGSESLAVLKAGETVLPPGARIGGRGSTIYDVSLNVQGSVIYERDLATMLRDELVKLGKANGTIFGGYA